MLPPETMQTIRPVAGAARERRRDGERAGALGDHAGPLGEQPHRGGRLVERQRDGAGERAAGRAPTSAASSALLPAPSTNDGV